MPRASRHSPSNVIPIAGRVKPLRCPTCQGAEVVQVDMIECVYDVRGVRRPGERVLVDIAGRICDAEAIGEQFYRCRACQSEWPLTPGTVFLDAGD